MGAEWVDMVFLAMECLRMMFFRHAQVLNQTSLGRIVVEAFFFFFFLQDGFREGLDPAEQEEETHSSLQPQLIKSQKIIESRIPKILQFHSASEEAILEVDNVALSAAQK